MRMLRRFGSLGVVMIVALASLLVGAAPALAVGSTHYENVGNPGWCLDGDGNHAYLHPCGGAYQLWEYSAPAVNLQLTQAVTRQCLTRLPNAHVELRTCGQTGDRWDAVGQNTGWVMLVSRVDPLRPACAIPFGTGVARPIYDIVMVACDPNNPNVPNIRAWRFH